MSPKKKREEVSNSVKALSRELFKAILYKDTNSVKKLIEKGADVNYSLKNELHEIPLLKAIAYSNEQILDFLLTAGANPNINFQSIGGGISTPIFYCLRQLKQEDPRVLTIIKLLLDYGADPSMQEYNYELPYGTPLHWAARTKNIGLIELLLDYEANINAVDFKGNTPLHGTYQDIDTIDILIKRGADPCIKNKEGKSFLMEMERIQYLPVLEYLQEQGFPVSETIIKTRKSYIEQLQKEKEQSKGANRLKYKNKQPSVGIRQTIREISDCIVAKIVKQCKHVNSPIAEIKFLYEEDFDCILPLSFSLKAENGEILFETETVRLGVDTSMVYTIDKLISSKPYEVFVDIYEEEYKYIEDEIIIAHYLGRYESIVAIKAIENTLREKGFLISKQCVSGISNMDHEEKTGERPLQTGVNALKEDFIEQWEVIPDEVVRKAFLQLFNGTVEI